MAAKISRPWHLTLFKLAAVLTYLLVASGGLVCITDASKGCPDWPVCHGRLIPPARMDSIIEYSHRVGAALTLPVILAALIVAWRRHRASRWVFRPVLGSVAGLLLVAWFGAAGVFWGLNRGWAAVDLGVALLTLALMVTAAVALSVGQRAVASGPAPSRPSRPSPGGPFTRLALAALIAVFAVLVSGVLVARPGSLVRCIGWPSPVGLSASVDLFDWLQLGRLGLAAAASLLVLALVIQAWRTQRGRPVLRRNTTVVGILLLAATIIAALVPAPDAGVLVPVASLLVTAGLWAFLTAVLARAALEIQPRCVAG